MQLNVTRKVMDELKKTVMSTTSYPRYLRPQFNTFIAIGLFHCLRTSVSDLIPNNT